MTQPQAIAVMPCHVQNAHLSNTHNYRCNNSIYPLHSEELISRFAATVTTRTTRHVNLFFHHLPGVSLISFLFSSVTNTNKKRIPKSSIRSSCINMIDISQKWALLEQSVTPVAYDSIWCERDRYPLHADNHHGLSGGQTTAQHTAIANADPHRLQSPLVAGLPNVGNSCFINAVLQCLLHSPRLAQHYRHQPHLTAMRSLHQLREDHPNYSPDSLATLLRQVTAHKRWQYGRQQDAAEFLEWIMHEPDIALPTIQHDVGCHMTCQTCGDTSTRTNRFFIWQLDPLHNSTIKTE